MKNYLKGIYYYHIIILIVINVISLYNTVYVDKYLKSIQSQLSYRIPTLLMKTRPKSLIKSQTKQ